MDVDVMRSEALDECQPDEIEEAAQAIAAALRGTGDRRPAPIEVALSPGNGTRYALLFVPAKACDRYRSVGEGFESSGAGVDGVFFTWLNGREGRTYPLRLFGRGGAPAPDYIAEKWQDGRVTFDTFIFEALFQRVGELTAEPSPV